MNRRGFLKLAAIGAAAGGAMTLGRTVSDFGYNSLAEARGDDISDLSGVDIGRLAL